MKWTKKIYKTIVYRVINLFLTWIVMFILSGEPMKSTYLTMILEIIKTTVYFLFEIAWERKDKNLFEIK